VCSQQRVLFEIRCNSISIFKIQNTLTLVRHIVMNYFSVGYVVLQEMWII